MYVEKRGISPQSEQFAAQLLSSEIIFRIKAMEQYEQYGYANSVSSGTRKIIPKRDALYKYLTDSS
jgi:hypothetical protein